jgi:hypothetical protein
VSVGSCAKMQRLVVELWPTMVGFFYCWNNVRMLCLYDSLLADGRSNVFLPFGLIGCDCAPIGLETFDGLVTKRRMDLRDRVGIGVEKRATP